MIRTHRLTAVNPAWRSALVFLMAGALVAACSSTPSGSPSMSAVPSSAVPSSSASEGTVASPSSSASEAPSTSLLPPPPQFPCGEPDPTCVSAKVVMQRGLPLMDPIKCHPELGECILRIDSFAMPDTHGVPIVVMIPGGPLPPGNRDYLWELARWVAARGAVVFTSDYRSSPTYGGGYPATFADVACAIRVARMRGADLGGDPSRVTLVAHSFGGFPAAVVALSTHDFARDDASCAATAGSGRPQAFVGVAGVYTLDRIGAPFLTSFFGGDPTTGTAAAWAAGDPAKLAEAAKQLIPIHLLAGDQDPTAPPGTARRLMQALPSSGGATLTVESGVTHDSILSTPRTVDEIEAVMTGH